VKIKKREVRRKNESQRKRGRGEKYEVGFSLLFALFT